MLFNCLGGGKQNLILISVNLGGFLDCFNLAFWKFLILGIAHKRHREQKRPQNSPLILNFFMLSVTTSKSILTNPKISHQMKRAKSNLLSKYIFFQYFHFYYSDFFRQSLNKSSFYFSIKVASKR